MDKDATQGLLDDRHAQPADCSRDAYRLHPSEAPTEGVRRIARGRVERAAESLREARRNEDPSGCVHSARKDLKKVRAVLRLVRNELGEDVYCDENRAYREAGRLLSESRDAEVRVATLEGISAGEAKAPEAAAAREWLTALRDERDLALGSLFDGGAAALGDALALIEASGERIEAWPLRCETFELVGPGVREAFRRGRKRMRRAGSPPDAEDLHEWRKRAKDLWYQLRILEGPASRELGRRVEIADKLADALGVHHDLAVLCGDLASREMPEADRTTLVTSIAARQHELEAEAFELGGRLYAEKPRLFQRKLRAGWRAWKEG